MYPKRIEYADVVVNFEGRGGFSEVRTVVYDESLALLTSV